MPFIDAEEIELNVIWIGENPMPPEQLSNLLVIINLNPKAKINIWVDSKITYDILTKQIVGTVFKNEHKNFAFIVISEDSLKIPPKLHGLLEHTKIAKLWAGYSDLLRLFILARPLTKEPKRHARFYIEADNKIHPRIWDRFKNKDVVAFFQQKDQGLPLFGPEHIRGDMIYLDVTSPNGIEFVNHLPMHMESYLCDSLMKIYFTALIENAKINNGLHENDVMASYGMVVQAIYRMQFMKATSEKFYGMEDFLFSLESIDKDYMPGYINIQAKRTHRSWENTNIKQPIDNGILFTFILLRLFAISDPSEIMLKGLLSKLEMQYRVNISSVADYVNLASALLNKIHGGKLPEWFKECRQQIMAPKVSPRTTPE